MEQKLLTFRTATFVIRSAEMAEDRVHRAADLFALLLDAN